MGHELQIENGGASLMYVGEEPWHGLGTKLDAPATSEEAIRAAGLEWTVVKKPIVAVEGRQRHVVKDRYAVIREDWWGKQGKPVFGIVGKDYTPLQNLDAFAFFDDIVGQKQAIYHTAGALGDGERVWILAKLPDSICVIGDDIAEKYLLLSNSHDGNSSVQIKFTPIRVVCKNTLTMALSGGSTLRVPHTKNLAQRMVEATRLLGIVKSHYERIEITFKQMAQEVMSVERLNRYLDAVFPEPADPANERGKARAIENRRWSRFFFECGKGHDAPGVSGTLWAAYNGVTEFVDHTVPLRRGGPGKAQASGVRRRSLDSLWFGEGYQAKARAFRIAAEMALCEMS